MNLKYGFNILVDLYEDNNWDNTISIAKDNEDKEITLSNYIVDLRSTILKDDRDGIFIWDMNSNQNIDGVTELLQNRISLISSEEINIQNFKVAILGQAVLNKNGDVYFSKQKKILLM